ncbi:S9 family peptidase, partial [Sphingopyxis sp. BSNA05]|nr:S9 family peptidase [Sphingopyxis sp. BSNA05]
MVFARFCRIGMAILALAGASGAVAGEAVAPRPAALVADQAPDIPQEIVDRTRSYMEYRTASFVDWDPKTRAMLIATRFADTSQLHRVATPMGQR